MYSYRYINKFYQFGETNYTLILEDLDSDPIKVVRIDKTFQKSPDEIDDEFLYQEARKEIIRITYEDTLDPVVVNKEDTLEQKNEQGEQ